VRPPDKQTAWVNAATVPQGPAGLGAPTMVFTFEAAARFESLLAAAEDDAVRAAVEDAARARKKRYGRPFFFFFFFFFFSFFFLLQHFFKMNSLSNSSITNNLQQTCDGLGTPAITR
jgi:hypothetical protein